MAWFKTDAEAWKAVVDDLRGKWPRSLCVLDLAYWENRVRVSKGREEFPSHRDFATRWGWHPSSAFRLMKACDPQAKQQRSTNRSTKASKNADRSEASEARVKHQPKSTRVSTDHKEEEGKEDMKMEPPGSVKGTPLTLSDDVDAILRETGAWVGDGLIPAPIGVLALTAMDECGGAGAFRETLEWVYSKTPHPDAKPFAGKRLRWLLKDLGEVCQLRLRVDPPRKKPAAPPPETMAVAPAPWHRPRLKVLNGGDE